MNGSLNLIRKPHLELSSKANLSSSITGRALLFRVLPRRIAGPPRRIFYSRKGAKTQRNSGPLGLTSGGLGGLATLRAIFFSCKAAEPQRNSSQFFAPSLLCSLPRRIAGPPRRIFFRAEAQRRKKIVVCSV